jgi:Xaa-Pro aminopeptidase
MKFKWILIFAILLVSCQNVEEIKKPDSLIPEQKMVEVLTDLSILYSAKNYNKKILEETGLPLKTYLYKKHQIDSLQLAQSTEYYAKNYTQFKKIYNQVKLNLDNMKTDLEVVQAEEKCIKDSIRDSKAILDSLRLIPQIKRKLIDSLKLIPAQREIKNEEEYYFKVFF